MRLAIMQPYFFPYIGYFQLISAVDAFVFLDDVQYIDRGWMNRNRLLLGGQPHWWTRAVDGKQSRDTIVRDRKYSRSRDADLLRQYRSGYRGEMADRIGQQVADWLMDPDDRVGAFNERTVREIADLLELHTKFRCSSDLKLPTSLRGTARILAICQELEATEYVNAIGGVQLYHDEDFEEIGIQLSFLATKAEPEPEGAGLLSILHEISIRGIAGTKVRLPHYLTCTRSEALEAAP
jgi:hypothetical protein